MNRILFKRQNENLYSINVKLIHNQDLYKNQQSSEYWCKKWKCMWKWSRKKYITDKNPFIYHFLDQYIDILKDGGCFHYHYHDYKMLYLSLQYLRNIFYHFYFNFKIIGKIANMFIGNINRQFIQWFRPTDKLPSLSSCNYPKHCCSAWEYSCLFNSCFFALSQYFEPFLVLCLPILLHIILWQNSWISMGHYRNYSKNLIGKPVESD